MCEEESVLVSTLRRMPAFKGKQEGIRRLAKRSSIEVESRIVLISGPRRMNCVWKDESSTVRYCRHEVSKKTATLGN